MIFAEGLPLWYDPMKWLVGLALGAASAWAVSIARKSANAVKSEATIILVDKHETRIRALEDTSIRVDSRLTYIEKGIETLVGRKERQ